MYKSWAKEFAELYDKRGWHAAAAYVDRDIAEEHREPLQPYAKEALEALGYTFP